MSEKKTKLLGTAQNLADLIGVHLNTVIKYKNMGVFKSESNSAMSKYNIPENIQAYLKYRLKGIDPSKELDFNREKTLLTKAQREITEIKLQRERLELLPADEVESCWLGMIHTFRGKLLDLPTRVAPLVVNKTDLDIITNILKTEVYEALTELSELKPEEYVKQELGEDEEQ